MPSENSMGYQCHRCSYATWCPRFAARHSRIDCDGNRSTTCRRLTICWIAQQGRSWTKPLGETVAEALLSEYEHRCRACHVCAAYLRLLNAYVKGWNGQTGC